jgi:hypothetical protein
MVSLAQAHLNQLQLLICALTGGFSKKLSSEAQH